MSEFICPECKKRFKEKGMCPDCHKALDKCCPVCGEQIEFCTCTGFIESSKAPTHH